MEALLLCATEKGTPARGQGEVRRWRRALHVRYWLWPPRRAWVQLRASRASHWEEAPVQARWCCIRRVFRFREFFWRLESSLRDGAACLDWAPRQSREDRLRCLPGGLRPRLGRGGQGF